jgi:uncharacterized membrane protein (DUF441 family)
MVFSYFDRMIRIVQIACIVVTAAILWMIGRGFTWMIDAGGPRFVDGFLCGAIFIVAMYGLCCWLDPSSRPRGSAPKQD